MSFVLLLRKLTMTERPDSMGLRSSQYTVPSKIWTWSRVTDSEVMRPLVIGDFQLPKGSIFLVIFNSVKRVF